MQATIVDFVPFYFSATIGINLLCAAVLFASAVYQKKAHFKSSFAGCIVAIFYQYSSWHYHDAHTTNEALFWLSAQTSAVIIALPLYLLVFVHWTRQTYSFKWVIGFVLISVAFLVLNITSEYTLRFSDTIELTRYTLFSGEEISKITGERNSYMKLFIAYSIAVFCMFVWLAGILIQHKRYLLSGILITTLVLQICVVVVSIYIETAELNFIYIGAVPVTLLNFWACISIATSLERKTQSLKNQMEEKLKLEGAFKSLAKGVSSAVSDQFYVNTVRELKNMSGAETAYLCLYHKENGEEMITNSAMFVGDKLLENITYPLKSVPEGLVTYKKILRIKDKLYQRYPNVKLFTSIKAVSLVNAPMINEDGVLEGSIVLLFKEKLALSGTFYKILDVFLSRIGSEIRRNRLEKAMHQMAYYDYQTGLPNLVKLHELINVCYRYDTEHNTKSALIVFDLKKFTDVNRQYGFENAEKALKALAIRLTNYNNKEITAVRVGGNKFAVLFKNVRNNIEGMVSLHWDAIRSIVKTPIKVGPRSISLDCNGGSVCFPIDIETNIEIVRCAEIALSLAKQDKNNSLRKFSVGLLEEIDRKAEVERLLEIAVNQEKDLFAVYQPKVDPNGKLIGAEALCRWIDKDLGVVPPDEFIVLAEKSDLIVKLGMWMVSTVCKQLNEWKQQDFYMPGRIAINVSAIQLIDEQFVPTLISTLLTHQISPTQIEIELTESGLLTNINQSISNLQLLRDAGFTIALDDFGTGYSSLSYLKDLPLDVLKIDRSFVNSLGTKNTAELARSIIAIGKHMSMDIVAEGVEELSQVEALQDMGCKVFQGFYFAKPLSANDLLSWVKQQVPKAESS